MMSRFEWYTITAVRCGGLLVLVVVAGNRVEKMMLAPWTNWILGAIATTVGVAILNTWAVSYETYLKGDEKNDL